MQTAAFLRTLFPLSDTDDPRARDIVRFAVVGKDTKFPGTVHYRTRAELHALNETGISALGIDIMGKDVYFTPHGFTRRAIDLTKEDAAPLLDVAWVELDDADIPPDTFSPPPSVVVNTSLNRYHLYWLLDQPTPAAEVERINYRLTYGNGLKQDKGGWSLTKWLRLPGGVSYKRSEPFAIKIVSADVARVYSVDDFNDLPDAPQLLVASGQRPPTPDADLLPQKEDIVDRYNLTRELIDLLDRPRKDRSAALWSIYHECYRLGLTEEECFVLVRGSANDKFHSDWRYNADEDLWKDIYRGYQMAHTPTDAPVLAKIKDVRQRQIPASEKRWEIAQLIAQDLSTTGRIYFDEERREALYYDGHHIVPMDPTNRQWKALLNLRYRVVDGENEFRSINANLYAIATQDGEPVSPKTASYWNRERKLLYVYNGGGRVYRLDGESIEIVDNGTDGILFRDSGFSEPFIAEEAQKGKNTPSLEDAIFGLPNYEDEVGRHTRTQAITMLKTWVYSLFFAEQMDARPHLIVTGPTDSGKSLVFQAITELLSGPKSTVSAIPTDRTTFETIVSNAHHVFLDNVDTPNKWLEDALCEVATGIQFTRRLLYTTNDHITYQVQCHLGMTTRNTWFTRADVATRLVVLYVERRALKTSPTVLLDRIRENRSYLWFELLQDLNKIVAALGTQVVGQHRLRMAGYADFVIACCRALGINQIGLLEAIEGNQRGSALDSSILWTCLESWLRTPSKNLETQEEELKNNAQWINTSRLHADLKRTAERLGCAREYEKQITSARVLSHQLRELVPDIQHSVKVEFKKKHPANEYRFTLPENTAEKEVPMAA